MTTVKLLFTSSSLEFGNELCRWLEPLGVSTSSVVNFDSGMSENWIVEVLPETAKQIYDKLKDPSSDKALPNMVSATFPTAALPANAKGLNVVLGNGVVQQKKLIRNLAPMVSTPDMRKDLTPMFKGM